MQLVLVAHGCRASFQITHVRVVVGHDERALKLSGVAGVDAEVAAQFHGASDAFGDVDKRAVAEHSAVEGCKEVVAIGDHSAQVLSHQVGMLFDGLADRAEDDAFLAQLLLEGGLHRHRVHDGVDGGVATQRQTLLQGNAQLVEGLLQFGVYLSVARRFLGHRVGIIGNFLIVDRRHMHVSPLRLGLLFPVAERLQSELEHPLGLAFLG